MGKEKLSIKYLLSLLVADIDIFLLQNKEQTNDLQKYCFSKKEIREQIENSVCKLANTLENLGYNIENPL